MIVKKYTNEMVCKLKIIRESVCKWKNILVKMYVSEKVCKWKGVQMKMYVSENICKWKYM